MPWLFSEPNNYLLTEGFLYDTVSSGFLSVNTDPTLTVPYLWWIPESFTYVQGLYWWDQFPEFSGENEEYLEDLTFIKFTVYENPSQFSYMVLPKLENSPFPLLEDENLPYLQKFVYSSSNDPSTDLVDIFTHLLSPDPENPSGLSVVSLVNSEENLTVFDLLPQFERNEDEPIVIEPCSESTTNLALDCRAPVTSVPEYSSALGFILLGMAFCCGLFKRRKH